MSVVENVAEKARAIERYYHPKAPSPDSFEDRPITQYDLTISEHGNILHIRVAESTDDGLVTGKDHRGEIAITIVAPNSTRSMWVNGKLAAEWLGELRKITDSMFRDPEAFAYPGDEI